MLNVYLRILLASQSNPCSADNGCSGKRWVSLKSGVTRSSLPDYGNKPRTKGPPRCTPNQVPGQERREQAAASLRETHGRGELRSVGWGRARALGAQGRSPAPGAARPASRRRGAGVVPGARPGGAGRGRARADRAGARRVPPRGGERRAGAARSPPPGRSCPPAAGRCVRTQSALPAALLPPAQGARTRRHTRGHGPHCRAARLAGGGCAPRGSTLCPALPADPPQGQWGIVGGCA